MSQLLQRKSDSLQRALDVLRRVLAAGFPGRERQWAQTVGEALARLETTLRHNLELAEAHEGSLAEVDDTRPTLSREADALCKEQEGLLRQILALREQARLAADAFQHAADPSRKETVACVPNFGAIRQRGEQLLAGLKRARETEAQLVLESVNTDIGVGD